MQHPYTRNPHHQPQAKALRLSPRTLHHIFLKHPEEAGEGYFEHLAFTLKYGYEIAAIAVALVLHGLFPCCHQTTASRRIASLNALFKSRRDKSYGPRPE